MANDSRLSAAAIAALQMGNVIEAIKVTRRETGLDLKGAKDLVDAHIANDPLLSESLRSRSRFGSFGLVLMVLLIAAAVIYFFPK